jgi:hypothetical protein
MNYHVILVNRYFGGSHQQFPVSGKSGKLYGHAALDAAKGGLVFKMSAEDYEKDKFDIVGNERAGHQWVPEFVAEPSAEAPPTVEQPSEETGEALGDQQFIESILRKLGERFDSAEINCGSNGTTHRGTRTVVGDTVNEGYGSGTEFVPDFPVITSSDPVPFLQKQSIGILRTIAKRQQIKLHNPSRQQLVDAIADNFKGGTS